MMNATESRNAQRITIRRLAIAQGLALSPLAWSARQIQARLARLAHPGDRTRLFLVSEATVRADLRALVEAGSVIRITGSRTCYTHVDQPARMGPSGHDRYLAKRRARQAVQRLLVLRSGLTDVHLVRNRVSASYSHRTGRTTCLTSGRAWSVSIGRSALLVRAMRNPGLSRAPRVTRWRVSARVRAVRAVRAVRTAKEIARESATARALMNSALHLRNLARACEEGAQPIQAADGGTVIPTPHQLRIALQLAIVTRRLNDMMTGAARWDAEALPAETQALVDAILAQQGS